MLYFVRASTVLILVHIIEEMASGLGRLYSAGLLALYNPFRLLIRSLPYIDLSKLNPLLIVSHDIKISLAFACVRIVNKSVLSGIVLLTNHFHFIA